MNRYFISLVLVLLIAFSSVVAQQPMEISRIDDTIIMDGMPDELAWQKLEPLSFTTYYPEAGKEPTERSDVRIGYDDDYLYIGAELYYSDVSLVKTTSYKRDHSGNSSDFFGIILDTFNNNETAQAFYVFPNGVRTDFSIFNDSEGDYPLNFDWNTFWNVETNLNEEGWFLEIRIPFSSLRYNTNDDKVTMGMIVNRWIARKNESVLMPAIPNNRGWYGQYRPSKAKKIVFENLDNHTPLYVTPYLLGGMEHQQSINNTETDYVRNDETIFDLGLDIKYGITSNLNLDVTLNTDFAQVEADNQQVNLTRFSLFFPEKRQFFQERANLFDFNFGGDNRLFYSRRIGIHQNESVRILGGARLTGNMGNWDVGLINMQTGREAKIPTENFGVFRLRRKVLNDYSYAGTMVTSRIRADGEYNYATGFDGVFRLADNTYLLTNVAQTFQNDYSNTFIDLDASRIRTQLENRSIDGFGYNLEYSRAGESYNPGSGFELRSDFTKWGNEISFGWFTNNDSPVLNYQLSLNATGYHRNFDGSAETIELAPKLTINFKSGADLNISSTYFYENLLRDFTLVDNLHIPRGSYTYTTWLEGHYSTSSSDRLIFSSSLSLGQFFDGHQWSGSLSPTWSVNPKLKFNGYYQLNRLDFPVRDSHFTTHLGRLRVEYYFNRKFTISTFAQYSNLTEQISTNFRFRFNPQEGNDLYIVYNEGLNTNRYSFTPVKPVSGIRTLLLKYTYTFNY